MAVAVSVVDVTVRSGRRTECDEKGLVIVDSVFGFHTGHCVEYEPNEHATQVDLTGRD